MMTEGAWSRIFGRHFVVGLSGVLSVAIIVMIGFDIGEYYLKKTASPTFAVDTPSRSIAGYNVFALPLFLSLLFGKRYILSFALTVIYAGWHAYSIWLRLQGCYLGEDICPEVPLMEKLSYRTDWLDLVVTAVLVSLFAWHFAILIGRSKSAAVQDNYSSRGGSSRV